MKIRKIGAGERVEVSLPIQAYAFGASPAEPGLWKTLEDNQEYYRDNVTLVIEEGGVPQGDASAISMRQNLRGNVYSMAAAFRLLDGQRSRVRVRDFDVADAISSTAGMLTLVYALVNAPSAGWARPVRSARWPSRPRCSPRSWSSRRGSVTR